MDTRFLRIIPKPEALRYPPFPPRSIPRWRLHHTQGPQRLLRGCQRSVRPEFLETRGGLGPCAWSGGGRPESRRRPTTRSRFRRRFHGGATRDDDAFSRGRGIRSVTELSRSAAIQRARIGCAFRESPARL